MSVPPDSSKQDEQRRLEGLATEANKTHDDWLKRWAFSLSVSNAAAALAVGGAVLDDPKKSIVLASAWFYFAGLLCAGIMPYALSRSALATGNYFFARSQIAIGNGKAKITDLGETQTIKEYADRNMAQRSKFHRVSDIAGGLSAGMFVVGSVWGLLALMQIK